MKMRFQPAADMGKRGDLVAEQLPGRTGEHHQAALRVLGDGELPFAKSLQGVAMARRDGYPTLGVQRQR